MRVKVGDKTWIFNPTCITAVDDDTTAKNVPQLTKQETRGITDDEDSSSSDESGGQGILKLKRYIIPTDYTPTQYGVHQNQLVNPSFLMIFCCNYGLICGFI